jgi:hypothetical protein
MAAEREPQFHIQIDRNHYVVHEPHLTGAELRSLESPPIPADRDLYEVLPGREDLLIEDNDRVTMDSGLRFFTAPGRINPGSDRHA